MNIKYIRLVEKIIRDYTVKPISYLINKSIHKGHFPSSLNLATVLPIYKQKKEQIQSITGQYL